MTGKEKLEMGNVERLKVCMTDGTEIDDDEILKSCSDGTILHFICESDAEASQEMAEKPSSQREKDSEHERTLVELSVDKLQERAKIFSCTNLTNYQQNVNAAALELCKDDASLLLNKGKLFEEARLKVDASGYQYAKMASRSTVYGTGKQPGKPKRKYVGAEIRAARVKELTESISSLKETIELLCKQKQQYSNAEKFLQAADVNSSILEKNREKGMLENELKALNKSEKALR
ncbi:nuclear localization sequence-binding -like, partial [Paramuricea clavata]